MISRLLDNSCDWEENDQTLSDPIYLVTELSTEYLQEYSLPAQSIVWTKYLDSQHASFRFLHNSVVIKMWLPSPDSSDLEDLCADLWDDVHSSLKPGT